MAAPTPPMHTTPEPNNMTHLMISMTPIIASGNTSIIVTILFLKSNAKQNNMTPNTRLPHVFFSQFYPADIAKVKSKSTNTGQKNGEQQIKPIPCACSYHCHRKRKNKDDNQKDGRKTSVVDFHQGSEQCESTHRSEN